MIFVYSSVDNNGFFRKCDVTFMPELRMGFGVRILTFSLIVDTLLRSE